MDLFSSEIDPTKASVRINKLREQIRHHDFLYYVQSKPDISDCGYDRLFKELQNLEEQYPALVSPDSPNQTLSP